MKISFLIIINVLYFSPSAWADTTEFNLCRLKDSVRSVRVIQTDSGKCLTVYVRSGKDQIMAESSNLSDCTNARDNILNNLKAGQFECQIAPEVNFTFIAPSNVEDKKSNDEDNKQ